MLDSGERNPGFTSLFASRTDEFGVSHKYCFALFEHDPVPEQIELAKLSASRKKSGLVIIGTTSSIEGISCVEWDRFVNLFGGFIFSSSPLEPEFSSQLIELGHNKLPIGLEGRPDDLFEIYVRNALEFIFGCRVIRYGQDRRFEARPDGIVIQNFRFSALFDAKAYSDGYEVSENSIRQFKSYVEDFKRMYSSFFDINAFIVVSGFFPHDSATLERRSRELQATVNTPLIFLSADVLSQIINLFLNHASLRRSINWRRVFVNPIINAKIVENEIKTILKDKVIKG